MLKGTVQTTVKKNLRAPRKLNKKKKV